MTIDDKIFELNKLGFMYPEVEFSNECPSNRVPWEFETRYKQYCILWFNLIREIWEEVDAESLVSSDDIRSAMFKRLYVDEVIKQHGRWFFGDKTNKIAYGEKFYNFVKGVYESSIA